MFLFQDDLSSSSPASTPSPANDPDYRPPKHQQQLPDPLGAGKPLLPALVPTSSPVINDSRELSRSQTPETPSAVEPKVTPSPPLHIPHLVHIKTEPLDTSPPQSFSPPSPTSRASMVKKEKSEYGSSDESPRQQPPYLSYYPYPYHHPYAPGLPSHYLPPFQPPSHSNPPAALSDSKAATSSSSRSNPADEGSNSSSTQPDLAAVHERLAGLPPREGHSRDHPHHHHSSASSLSLEQLQHQSSIGIKHSLLPQSHHAPPSISESPPPTLHVSSNDTIEPESIKPLPTNSDSVSMEVCDQRSSAALDLAKQPKVEADFIDPDVMSSEDEDDNRRTPSPGPDPTPCNKEEYRTAKAM